MFTDGSCDPDESSSFGIKAAYGAALFDPEDGTFETFGANIVHNLLKIVSCKGTKQQVVGQSELLPCHATQTLWNQNLRGRRLVLYVDNEAARFGLIKGTSPTLHSAWLINEYWTAESWNESNTWVERVPSASNCADGPSRGRFTILANSKLKVKRVRLPDWYEKGLVQQWINKTQESPKP